MLYVFLWFSVSREFGFDKANLKSCYEFFIYMIACIWKKIRFNNFLTLTQSNASFDTVIIKKQNPDFLSNCFTGL